MGVAKEDAPLQGSGNNRAKEDAPLQGSGNNRRGSGDNRIPREGNPRKKAVDSSHRRERLPQPRQTATAKATSGKTGISRRKKMIKINAPLLLKRTPGAAFERSFGPITQLSWALRACQPYMEVTCQDSLSSPII